MVLVEAPAMKPDAFNLEITRSFGSLTAGCKLGMANMTAPDLGCRYISGPIFASLLCKSKFSVFTAHCNYKVTNDLKLAGFYEHSSKPNCGLGLSYSINKETSLKAKVLQSQDICTTLKYTLSKGINVLLGAKFNVGKGYQG